MFLRGIHAGSTFYMGSLAGLHPIRQYSRYLADCTHNNWYLGRHDQWPRRLCGWCHPKGSSRVMERAHKRMWSMPTPVPWSRTRIRVVKALDGALPKIYAYVIHGRSSASNLSTTPSSHGKPIGGGSMINSTNERPLETMQRCSWTATRMHFLHESYKNRWKKIHGFLETTRRRQDNGHTIEDHVSSSNQ
jgi:hypothetical protein